MTLIQSRAVSFSSDFIKMEEKKRPVSHDHEDSGPPLKKQAMSVNGGSKSHVDADMPWQDDLEVSLSVPIPIDRMTIHPLLLAAHRFWPSTADNLSLRIALPKRSYMATNAGIQERTHSSRKSLDRNDKASRAS